MKRKLATWAGIAALVSGVNLLSGCVAARPAQSQAHWRPNKVIRAMVTPFWHQHPVDALGQPGMGAIPDRMLKQGERVRHVGGRLGYAKIQLSDRSTGWVIGGMMAPAP